jgi:hypothetical protein
VGFSRSKCRTAGIFLARKFTGEKNSGSKTKIRIFFQAKKVLPVRVIRIFCKKTGTAEKFTTKQNNDSKLYIRYPGNYPVTGWLLHLLFFARNFFCRIFFGSNVEKSKNFPVESFRTGKFPARTPKNRGRNFFGHENILARDALVWNFCSVENL